MAKRLVYMDRDAAERVLSDLAGVATHMQSLVNVLALDRKATGQLAR